MPTTLPRHDFYVQHSPFGAFATFALGRLGKGGGFGLELGGPASQDVYVALVRPGEPVRSFPFYAGARTGGAEAYTGVQAAPEDAGSPRSWRQFAPEEIRRTLGWATDTWSAGDLTLRLLTPFTDIPDLTGLSDDDLRRLLCPALLAEITVDNRASDREAFAFFGIGAVDPLRPLADADAGLRGVARETQWGFAVAATEEARETLTWGIAGAVAQASSDAAPPRNRLANRGGLLLRAAPGERKTFTLALGFYRSGIATSGIAASYLYSRVFPDLESVLTYALAHADEFRRLAEARDAELDASPLNDDRKFLLAHATHSYLGSTMLLHDAHGAIPSLAVEGAAHRPFWAVNEGEYRMLNTFDLTVDHAFWEMRWHPWTLRNALDQFVDRYSYFDDVQDARSPHRTHAPGGISFTHDMGVANQFTPVGYSSYELPDLRGCFSYMTQEQLCNWCLSAALYALPTVAGPAAGWKGDWEWLRRRRETVIACLNSLIHRDGPEGERDGVMNLDAARCGTGQEITTYDSLDESLGQARANGYLAVKTWASYLALARCLRALGENDRAAQAEAQATLAAQTVAASWDEETQSFPSVMEPENPGWRSRIIPAIEGLAYPSFWGDEAAVSPRGPYGDLVSLLRRHLLTVLKPGVCLDAESGGWKLSSSSTNTWMSKIFLCQYVAETILGVASDPSCDAAHAKWQIEGDSRTFAFTDQVDSRDGRDLGSRWYPRGVTALLWVP